MLAISYIQLVFLRLQSPGQIVVESGKKATRSYLSLFWDSYGLLKCAVILRTYLLQDIYEKTEVSIWADRINWYLTDNGQAFHFSH